MKRFVLAVLALALTACPKAVRHDELVPGRFCYVLSIGVTVFTDGVPCPLYEALDAVAQRSAHRWGVEDNVRWRDTVLVLTHTPIDCGFAAWDLDRQAWVWHPRPAMGCSELPIEGQPWVELRFYISMWAKWRWYETAEHEFDHVSVFLLEGAPFSQRQWCLDNEEWCQDRLEFRR